MTTEIGVSPNESYDWALACGDCGFDFTMSSRQHLDELRALPQRYGALFRRIGLTGGAENASGTGLPPGAWSPLEHANHVTDALNDALGVIRAGGTPEGHSVAGNGPCADDRAKDVVVAVLELDAAISNLAAATPVSAEERTVTLSIRGVTIPVDQILARAAHEGRHHLWLLSTDPKYQRHQGPPDGHSGGGGQRPDPTRGAVSLQGPPHTAWRRDP